MKWPEISAAYKQSNIKEAKSLLSFYTVMHQQTSQLDRLDYQLLDRPINKTTFVTLSGITVASSVMK